MEQRSGATDLRGFKPTNLLVVNYKKSKHPFRIKFLNPGLWMTPGPYIRPGKIMSISDTRQIVEQSGKRLHR